MTTATSLEVLPVKTDDYPYAVATAWRPLLAKVVRCLAAGDYGLIAGGPGVEPVAVDLRLDLRLAIESYGASLVELPGPAWKRATSQWYSNHWVVCVDLWAKDGPTDLVLAGRIVEKASGPVFTMYSVHVAERDRFGARSRPFVG